MNAPKIANNKNMIGLTVVSLKRVAALRPIVSVAELRDTLLLAAPSIILLLSSFASSFDCWSLTVFLKSFANVVGPPPSELLLPATAH